MSYVGEKRLHAEEEYGAQLHRRSTYKLYEDVVYITKSLINDGLDELKEEMKEMVPKCDGEAAISSLKSEYNESVEMNGPELMNAIKKSLQIPCNVLLPEDAVQKQQYSDQELEEIHKRTSDLKKRYQYNVLFKEALLAESSVLDGLEDAETKVAEWQEMCKTMCDETNKVEDAANLLISTKKSEFDAVQRSTFVASASKTLEQ